LTTPIPMPLRAAAGLAAVAIDEARRLPTRLVGLPVLAMGAALQVSLKAQQRYAELAARGDELLGQLRGTQPGTPPWAHFDEDEDAPDGRPPSAFDAAAAAIDDDAFDDDTEDTFDDEDVLDDEDAFEAEDAFNSEDAFAAGDVIDATDVVDAAGEDVVDGAGPEPAASADPGPAADAVPPATGLDSITAVAVDGAGAVLGTAGSMEEEIGAVADDASRYDGYLPAAPLPGYDAMSIPQLRARLRALSERQLVELVDYERATAQRPPYLTMLENRLATVRGR
jgi:hypothetical protein